MITILALALLAFVSIWGAIDLLRQIDRNENERKKPNWLPKRIDSGEKERGEGNQGNCPRDRKVLFLHLFSFEK